MNSFGVPISAPTLLSLQAYLHTHPSAGSMGEVVDAAINAWLAAQTSSRQGDPGVGYQWKSLFLPAGTQVRFDYEGHTYHAKVEGDHLIYRGQPTSPRGMLMAVAGLTGNAWKLLRIRRPGDKHFHIPSVLRAQQARDDTATGCAEENALTRRVVDALGRIESALRERRHEIACRRDASRKPRSPVPRRESDCPPSAQPSAAHHQHESFAQGPASRSESELADSLGDVPFDPMPLQSDPAQCWPPIQGLPPAAGWADLDGRYRPGSPSS
jgi:hypothetical protein